MNDSATKELSKYIGNKKVDLLIKIKKFIAQQSKDSGLHSESKLVVRSLNRIVKELIKLQELRYIERGKAVPVINDDFPRGPIYRLIDPIFNEIQMEFLMRHSRNPIKCSYSTISEESISVIQDSFKFSCWERKRGQKRRDLYNIILFLTVTLLKRRKCRDIYRIAAHFLDEQGVHLSSTTNDSLSTQYRRLKKGDIEKHYKSYYENSTQAKSNPNATSSAKIMIYKAIPSWEGMLQ